MRMYCRFLCLLLCIVLAMPAALASSMYESTRDPDPIPVLSENEIPPTPEGIEHYMLICCDRWDAKLENLGHTDGLILVTVDTYARRVMLTSFIRDMLILRPDGDFGRINNICGKYGSGKNGIETLVGVINSHFGLKIDKYIVVDFGQVERIVDAIGGVDITITDKEANYLKNYRISASSTEPAINRGGTYHFSGHAAVNYIRIRKVLTLSGSSKSDRVRAVIRENIGNITKGEIIKQCPDISKITVERALKEMIDNNEIIKIGGGRYTSYVWNWEEEK